MLLLGGSTEASALAGLLASDPRFDCIFSLAGRTAAPRPQPVAVRSGGFGGVAGLVSYLKGEGIDTLVDATHPFASRMSRNAIVAASKAGTPLLAVERAPWLRQVGDNWIESADAASAISAIGPEPRTVFCALGSLALPELQCAPQHRYIIRIISCPRISGHTGCDLYTGARTIFDGIRPSTVQAPQR